jgi:hypothetical protein
VSPHIAPSLAAATQAPVRAAGRLWLPGPRALVGPLGLRYPNDGFTASGYPRYGWGMGYPHPGFPGTGPTQ